LTRPAFTPGAKRGAKRDFTDFHIKTAGAEKSRAGNFSKERKFSLVRVGRGVFRAAETANGI
jgi:hypothetical protein